MVGMCAQVTLEMVYNEVRRVNERLDLIENIIEETIMRDLPQVRVDRQKREEIGRSIKEMKRGSFVTLEELKSA